MAQGRVMLTDNAHILGEACQSQYLANSGFVLIRLFSFFNLTFRDICPRWSVIPPLTGKQADIGQRGRGQSPVRHVQW